MFRRLNSSRAKAGARGAAARGDDAPNSQVVALLAARDPRGVVLAYDRWGAPIYTVALALVSDEAEAEKIVANAYLGLWKQAEVALSHEHGPKGFLVDAVLRGTDALSSTTFGGLDARYRRSLLRALVARISMAANDREEHARHAGG